MSQSTIRNIIISSVLMLMAAGAFGLMVYRVLWQGGQLTAQIVALEEEQSQEASYYNLVRLSEETSEKRSQLEKYFLLKESDSIDFLNKVESMAPQAGVQLKTNGLELIKDEEGGGEWVKVGFTFNGSRMQVQKFIQILETLPYVLRITSANIEARSSAEWSANVSMQVRVLSYDK